MGVGRVGGGVAVADELEDALHDAAGGEASLRVVVPALLDGLAEGGEALQRRR